MSKQTLLTSFYTLPTILYLCEDFSNLSRTQHSTMSTPSGCINVVAYVPPAQGIKPFVTSSTELKQLEGYEVTLCNVQTSLPKIGGILLRVNIL